MKKETSRLVQAALSDVLPQMYSDHGSIESAYPVSSKQRSTHRGSKNELPSD